MDEPGEARVEVKGSVVAKAEWQLNTRARGHSTLNILLLSSRLPVPARAQVLARSQHYGCYADESLTSARPGIILTIDEEATRWCPESARWREGESGLAAPESFAQVCKGACQHVVVVGAWWGIDGTVNLTALAAPAHLGSFRENEHVAWYVLVVDHGVDL